MCVCVCVRVCVYNIYISLESFHQPSICKRLINYYKDGNEKNSWKYFVYT